MAAVRLPSARLRLAETIADAGGSSSRSARMLRETVSKLWSSPSAFDAFTFLPLPSTCQNGVASKRIVETVVSDMVDVFCSLLRALIGFLTGGLGLTLYVFIINSMSVDFYGD